MSVFPNSAPLSDYLITSTISSTEMYARLPGLYHHQYLIDKWLVHKLVCQIIIQYVSAYLVTRDETIWVNPVLRIMFEYIVIYCPIGTGYSCKKTFHMGTWILVVKKRYTPCITI